MGIVYLTRVERFNAAHKLWVSEWDDAKNIEIFGKCANKNWHGHNYKLEVTVKGTPDPLTGFVIDAKKLSVIIKEHVVDKLDHMNLNLDVDFIPKNIQPTTENLVMLIWDILEPKLYGCKLYRIKLIETETIFVEYYGEKN
jgi:6-pyruvoyltetrahydropterin/6-carboxytetrahydropterin synthase